MKTYRTIIIGFWLFIAFANTTYAYPPAVGIMSKSKSCLSCHVNNGPWTDNERTIIDIIDKETMKSVRRTDGTFLLEVKRGEQKTFFTVIGRTSGDNLPPPNRNAWIYIDPAKIESNELSKFAPGWEVNLPISCRVVGDKLHGFEGAVITALPMTIQPTKEAKDSELQLQLMLTKGESIKGEAKKGMLGNYFERKVILKVIE
ncbi:MAG: hypothetical protein HW421_1352 [Ignavibacteria bacterium]|nr:hypothetical protein [Ignavibacteria bacterium]